MPLSLLRFASSKYRASHVCFRREFSSASVLTANNGDTETDGKDALSKVQPLHRISEDSWRKASQEHSHRILEILSPGLTPLDHHLNTGLRRQLRQWERKEQRRKRQGQPFPAKGEATAIPAPVDDRITALDPKHPVYNFLIEYYGLKGTKGVRRLLKWSPGMQVFAANHGMRQSKTRGGILLEGATEQDFFTSLQAKGAVLCDDDEMNRGVLYFPLKYVNGNQPNLFRQHEKDCYQMDFHKEQVEENGTALSLASSNGGPLAPFLWYRSLLQRTLAATPILHCYGLHEWAMQYQPKLPKARNGGKRASNVPASQLPPSSKYQSHLKLRIRPEILNQTVEANTLFCSHVDAWKFFAKEALPRNEFGKRDNGSYTLEGLPSPEERPKWLLRSEQPACVHTTMDLLKIALKLGPFCEPNLFCRILALTVEARRLDVAASPYDAQTDYGVVPICIETPFGRNEYKQCQMELMKKATPIRRDLLENYELFLAALQSNSDA